MATTAPRLAHVMISLLSLFAIAAAVPSPEYPGNLLPGTVNASGPAKNASGAANASGIADAPRATNDTAPGNATMAALSAASASARPHQQPSCADCYDGSAATYLSPQCTGCCSAADQANLGQWDSGINTGSLACKMKNSAKAILMAGDLVSFPDDFTTKFQDGLNDDENGGELELSLSCSACYAGSVEHAYNHCRDDCWANWCSDGCATCSAQYTISVCSNVTDVSVADRSCGASLTVCP